MKESKFPDLAAGLLFTGVAVAVYLMSGSLTTVKLGLGAGGYPRTVAVMMFVLGLVMTVKSLWKGLPRPQFRMEKAAMFRLAMMLAATVAYVLLMRPIGFLFLTPFYLFGAMLIFGHRKYPAAAVISVVSSVVIYLIFTKAFMVFLPEFSLF